MTRPLRTPPGAPVLVDFESRSRANLKKVGGRKYWEHPSSEAIVAVLYDTGAPPDEAVSVWRPGDPPPELGTAVAHNATTFDRHAARRCGWRVGEWRDSSQMARRAGLPGALDALASEWLGRHKDSEGSKFTKALSRVSRAKGREGSWQKDANAPEIFSRVLAYCASDVEVLADAWPRLEPWADVDDDVRKVDGIVNDRGICVDVDLVHALQRQLERQKEEAIAKAAKALGRSEEETAAAARSPQQFCAETGLPNAQKDTLSDRAAYGDLVDHPLVAARQALANIVGGKLEAAIAMLSNDGRLRDQFFYYGAHTARWVGKGMQVQNLPRIGFEDAAKDIGWHAWEYIEALVDGAMTGERLSKKQVSGLLRSTLVAPAGHELGVLDYSGIEARANAWAADDHDALDVFRALDAGTGPDPYKVMAAKIFSIDVDAVTKEQRGLGKIAELMLGYGAGAPKFGESCAQAGVDLAAFGLDPQDIVDAYRKQAHRPIVQMWRDCEKAFASACEGKAMRAGRWTYEPFVDGGVACVLPSGRPMIYPKAQAKRRKTPWGGLGWELSYKGRIHREHVYGGLLVENAIQALCRDLLADALVRAEEAGLCPVMHVHDELVCQWPIGLGKEGLAEMRHIMQTTAPEWAEGLPIRLDGFAERRYRK